LAWQLGLEWLGVDCIEQVAPADERAFLEIHALEEALDPGPDRYILRPQRGAHHVDGQRHIPLFGRCHDDRECCCPGCSVFDGRIITCRKEQQEYEKQESSRKALSHPIHQWLSYHGVEGQIQTSPRSGDYTQYGSLCRMLIAFPRP
jgi:hypothetical protein